MTEPGVESSQPSVEEVAALARVFARELGHSIIVVPPRTLIMRERSFGAFVAMPAYCEDRGLFVTKIGAVVPCAPAVGQAVRSVVVAYREDGSPAEYLDGARVTNLKCAATSALVNDRCLPAGSVAMAIIGAGTQAEVQLRAALAVRDIEELRIYSRSNESGERFASAARLLSPSSQISVAATAADATVGADLVCTATTSTTPVVEGAALSTATHINCVGAHTPSSREVPVTVLRSATTLIVEDRATAIAEAGELHQRATSLAELVSGASDLRGKRTVFSSTGHAALDLLTVSHLLRRAPSEAVLDVSA